MSWQQQQPYGYPGQGYNHGQPPYSQGQPGGATLYPSLPGMPAPSSSGPMTMPSPEQYTSESTYSMPCASAPSYPLPPQGSYPAQFNGQTSNQSYASQYHHSHPEYSQYAPPPALPATIPIQFNQAPSQGQQISATSMPQSYPPPPQQQQQRPPPPVSMSQSPPSNPNYSSHLPPVHSRPLPPVPGSSPLMNNAQLIRPPVSPQRPQNSTISTYPGIQQAPMSGSQPQIVYASAPPQQQQQQQQQPTVIVRPIVVSAPVTVNTSNNGSQQSKTKFAEARYEFEGGGDCLSFIKGDTIEIIRPDQGMSLLN